MSDQTPNSVNDEIFECLDLDSPKSFFLFAGAGSGKTRSLVDVLEKFKKENVDRLRKRGQRVAIITYTNAARDEIRARLDFDSSFHVATIHSFTWELIRPYTVTGRLKCTTCGRFKMHHPRGSLLAANNSAVK